MTSQGMERSLNRILELLAKRNVLRHTPYVNGAWLQRSTERKYFPVHYPYTGELITEVQEVDEEDIKTSIQVASAAFQDWKKSSCKDRSKLLRQLFEKLVAHEEDIATICTLESGKPIIESRAELRYGASFIEWFAEESKRLYGDIIPTAESNIRRFVTKQPIGVAGLITPWNFPIAMMTRKLGAALCTGCTAIIKPAEDTPLTALAICSLIDEVGFPPGVVNVLPCSRSMAGIVGTKLCEDPLVQTVSFTGSTAVGKQLMGKCAKYVKRTSMELGGSAPFIVFNSADLDIAVKAAMVAKFRNNGQSCVAADRFFVQSDIHDEFVHKFRDACDKLVVGDPFQNDTTNGTLVNKKALFKIQDHVSDAIAKGAEVITQGTYSDGLLYPPTILTDCSMNMKIMKEETFGPIAPIMKFTKEEDVITLANDTNAGLAAYVCTSDYRQQWRVGEQIDFGMIGVNEGLISADFAPFGGVKESGIGREGSKYGIDEYMEVKYICIGGMNS